MKNEVNANCCTLHLLRGKMFGWYLGDSEGHVYCTVLDLLSASTHLPHSENVCVGPRASITAQLACAEALCYSAHLTQHTQCPKHVWAIWILGRASAGCGLGWSSKPQGRAHPAALCHHVQITLAWSNYVSEVSGCYLYMPCLLCHIMFF